MTMKPLLHHLSFGVADLARSAAFYDAVLGALGYRYRQVWPDEGSISYGPAEGEDTFAIKQAAAGAHPPGDGFHLAFSAASRAAVDAFHRAALAHGGRDNGAPGLRLDYAPDYYAAVVIDPDGYRIEAVILGD